jgi:aspartate/methionine/tyrosine aminotransferase
MTVGELKKEMDTLMEELARFKDMKISLNMSRGIPNEKVVELSALKFSKIDVYRNRIYKDGTDLGTYNQGLVSGITEAKEFFGEILEIPTGNIIVGGNSSLNLMYDLVAQNMMFGNCDSEKPWGAGKVKFICPVPGYDRHFAICEFMGIEMVAVPMTENGPDMDVVEDLAARDETIKGIWCVPMYSNPGGCVYSDETVKRLASMKTAAPDFRIFWDNAYSVHHLYNKPVKSLLNIFEEEKKSGNENRTYIFASTSKISMPGTGISAIASSDGNINNILARLKKQTIGYDKMNMIRHRIAFPDKKSVEEHMKKTAAIIRPNFEIVIETFEKELKGRGVAEWSEPAGGYFISFNAPAGCASETVKLCESVGVKLTPAGATFPYGRDPEDRNIRIAPTYPSYDEMEKAASIFCTCVKIASLDKILEGK